MVMAVVVIVCEGACVCVLLSVVVCARARVYVRVCVKVAGVLL